jgi:hypothetical protein
MVRSSRVFRSLCLAAALPGLVLTAGAAQAADGSVNVLVIKEQGVGSAAQAQPYVDRLVATAAKVSGWTAASGKYATNREGAEEYIHTADPHFAFMSLGAFLGLRGKHKLDVIGKAEVSQAGGRQYHIVSKNAADLAGCKGKTLASNHTDDARFAEKVVAGGAFLLADFTLVPTKRPVQTLKKVTSGEAECALIDDAQLAELAKIEGGAAVKSVWKSEKLPPMVVVAFPSAPAAERTTFKAALGKVCSGEGKAACSEVGIKDLSAAGASDYAAVVTAYGK